MRDEVLPFCGEGKPQRSRGGNRGCASEIACLVEYCYASKNWPVTFSMGAITFQRQPNFIHEMIVKADEAMYAPKTSGRNRVVIRKSAA